MKNENKNNELMVKYILGYILATTAYYAVWLFTIVLLCVFFESAAPLWLLLVAMFCQPYTKGD